MNVWSMLEIEPTNNQTDIRRAYSRLLKKYHPEDNPDGFMRLRTAYEQALKRASRSQSRIMAGDLQFMNEDKEEVAEECEQATTEQQNEIIYQIVIDEEWSEPLPISVIHQEIQIVIDEKCSEPLPIPVIIHQELQLIYDDVFSRRDIKKWTPLFLQFSLTDSELLAYEVSRFLSDHAHLPHDVWTYLNTEFSLTEIPDFPWKDLICYDYGLSLDYLDSSDNSCDFNQYAHLRFQAFLLLREMKYSESIAVAQQAAEVYDCDPVLYRMLGLSYYKMSDYGQAIEFLTRTIAIIPDDIDVLVHRGYAYYRMGSFDLAIADFERSLEINPSIVEARKGIGLSLHAINKLNQGIEKNAEPYENEMDQIDLEYDSLYKYNESMFVLPKPPQKETVITFLIRNIKVIPSIVLFGGIFLFLIYAAIQLAFVPGEIFLSILMIVVAGVFLIKLINRFGELER